jgi:cation diffusion facilitator CzcD-associated flavoprotein CzcO
MGSKPYLVPIVSRSLTKKTHFLIVDRSYASQPEILQYFRDTATKFDLEKFIKYDSEVVEARWNEEKGQWLVKICNRSTGATVEDWCHFLINGGGFLK